MSDERFKRIIRAWYNIRRISAESLAIRLNQPKITSEQARAQYLRTQGHLAEAHRVEYMERQKVQNELDFRNKDSIVEGNK